MTGIEEDPGTAAITGVSESGQRELFPSTWATEKRKETESGEFSPQGPNQALLV